MKLKIDKLKFAVRESKHSTLINLLRPLATGLIKSAVTKAMEAAIRTGLEQVDAQLSDISERLEDAQKQEGTNKIDALKQSFNEKKAEAQQKKAKAEKAARTSSLLLSVSFVQVVNNMFVLRSRRPVLAHPRPEGQARRLVGARLDARQGCPQAAAGASLGRLAQPGFHHCWPRRVQGRRHRDFRLGGAAGEPCLRYRCLASLDKIPQPVTTHSLS